MRSSNHSMRNYQPRDVRPMLPTFWPPYPGPRGWGTAGHDACRFVTRSPDWVADNGWDRRGSIQSLVYHPAHAVYAADFLMDSQRYDRSLSPLDHSFRRFQEQWCDREETYASFACPEPRRDMALGVSMLRNALASPMQRDREDLHAGWPAPYYNHTRNGRTASESSAIYQHDEQNHKSVSRLSKRSSGTRKTKESAKPRKRGTTSPSRPQDRPPPRAETLPNFLECSFSQRGDNASSASRTTDEQEPAIQNGAQNLESSGISSILEENIACDVIKKFLAQRVIFYYKEDGSLAGSDVATVSSDCCGATGEDFGPAGVDRAVAETESENETGLKIVDVRTVKEPSLPSAPSHVAERDLEEASVSGQDSETGLKIVDVRTVNEPSLPSAPLHVAERNLDEEASVSGQESETGLKIVDVRTVNEPSLSSALPDVAEGTPSLAGADIGHMTHLTVTNSVVDNFLMVSHCDAVASTSSKSAGSLLSSISPTCLKTSASDAGGDDQATSSPQNVQAEASLPEVAMEKVSTTCFACGATFTCGEDLDVHLDSHVTESPPQQVNQPAGDNAANSPTAAVDAYSRSPRAPVSDHTALKASASSTKRSANSPSQVAGGTSSKAQTNSLRNLQQLLDCGFKAIKTKNLCSDEEQGFSVNAVPEKENSCIKKSASPEDAPAQPSEHSGVANDKERRKLSLKRRRDGKEGHVKVSRCREPPPLQNTTSGTSSPATTAATASEAKADPSKTSTDRQQIVRSEVAPPPEPPQLTSSKKKSSSTTLASGHKGLSTPSATASSKTTTGCLPSAKSRKTDVLESSSSASTAAAASAPKQKLMSETLLGDKDSSGSTNGGPKADSGLKTASSSAAAAAGGSSASASSPASSKSQRKAEPQVSGAAASKAKAGTSSHLQQKARSETPPPANPSSKNKKDLPPTPLKSQHKVAPKSSAAPPPVTSKTKTKTVLPPSSTVQQKVSSEPKPASSASVKSETISSSAPSDSQQKSRSVLKSSSQLSSSSSNCMDLSPLQSQQKVGNDNKSSGKARSSMSIKKFIMSSPAISNLAKSLVSNRKSKENLTTEAKKKIVMREEHKPARPGHEQSRSANTDTSSSLSSSSSASSPTKKKFLSEARRREEQNDKRPRNKERSRSPSAEPSSGPDPSPPKKRRPTLDGSPPGPSAQHAPESDEDEWLMPMCPLCPMIFVSHEELGRHVLIHAKVRRKDVVKVKAYSSSGTASSAGGIARCKSSAVKIGSDDDPETDDD